MFAKTSSVQRIPPTRAALEQHIKRAAFQVGHIWGQALVSLPDLPIPCSWGWLRTDDGLYEPLWTTLEEASKSCYGLYFVVAAIKDVKHDASAKGWIAMHSSLQL